MTDILLTLECTNIVTTFKLSYQSTRPEVSEGGPAITNLIQGVAREEADRHRQIEVSSLTKLVQP